MSRIHAYEKEPYRRELDVEVLTIASDEEGRTFAILDDTILYPEGGGQPTDRGWLEGCRVVDVQRADGEIRHYLAAEADGETGEPSGAPAVGSARLRLDWERRYDHMQQHTAQHLLTAVAADRCGWPTTSFHLGAERSDIELGVEALAAHDMATLEDLVMAEVRAARPVTARRVAPDELAALGVRTRGLPEGHQGDVRLVEIAGVDLNTCGGTHLASTAEIEAVKLLGSEPMRGGTRLYWVAGRRLRRRLASHEERASALRRILETSDEEIVAMAEARVEQLAEAGRRIRFLEGRLVEASAQGLAARPEPVVEAHFEAVDASFLQHVARRLVALNPASVALLTSSGGGGGGSGAVESGGGGGGGGGHLFIVVAGEGSSVDVQDVGPRVAELLDGRGGGAGGIYQGKAGSLAARERAVGVLREAAV